MRGWKYLILVPPFTLAVRRAVTSPGGGWATLCRDPILSLSLSSPSSKWEEKKKAKGVLFQNIIPLRQLIFPSGCWFRITPIERSRPISIHFRQLRKNKMLSRKTTPARKLFLFSLQYFLLTWNVFPPLNPWSWWWPFFQLLLSLPTCVLGWMLSQQDEMECRLWNIWLNFSFLADVAPPPYTRLGLNHDRPHRLPSYPVESLETGGTNQYSSTGSNLGNWVDC